jgi:AraC-like DNA-binding protein
MLLSKDDYEAKITTDDGAGQIPSATREVYELICVTKGFAEYWVETEHYKLQKGDILFVPVGTMVGATLKTRGCPFEKIGVWFSRRYMTFLKLQDTDADFSFRLCEHLGSYLLRPQGELFEEIKTCFETLAAECQSEELNAELSTKTAFSALCVKLNRFAAQHGNEFLIAGDNNRLTPVLEYVHKNCTDAVSVEYLAQKFGYSPSHLAHSFKKQMGTSLYHYVLLRRLQIGREVMLEGIPIKEAFKKCGFGDYAGFYRAFIKEFGISPQQYKKSNQ